MPQPRLSKPRPSDQRQLHGRRGGKLYTLCYHKTGTSQPFWPTGFGDVQGWGSVGRSTPYGSPLDQGGVRHIDEKLSHNVQSLGKVCQCLWPCNCWVTTCRIAETATIGPNIHFAYTHAGFGIEGAGNFHRDHAGTKRRLLRTCQRFNCAGSVSNINFEYQKTRTELVLSTGDMYAMTPVGQGALPVEQALFQKHTPRHTGSMYATLVVDVPAIGGADLGEMVRAREQALLPMLELPPVSEAELFALLEKVRGFDVGGGGC